MLGIKPIKTPLFRMGDDLISFLIENIEQEFREGKILAITSKIVSLSEDRLISSKQISKEDLVKQEADLYIGKTEHNCHLTIKEGILLASAGIDESNSETGDFILYPKNPFLSAKKIYEQVKEKFQLTHFGILITDSKTTALRRGVTGVALSYYGFKGVQSRIGEMDLFNRELKMTQINVADALASAATLLMGEGNESSPLALIDYKAEFCIQNDNNEIKIDVKEDLYWPLLRKIIHSPDSALCSK